MSDSLVRMIDAPDLRRAARVRGYSQGQATDYARRILYNALLYGQPYGLVPVCSDCATSNCRHNYTRLELPLEVLMNLAESDLEAALRLNKATKSMQFLLQYLADEWLARAT